ncbi:SDR family NAD(P)-dependent oxidoreductase [Modestobacter roseus]|uniref:Short-subunit dehydrogenase n=1 Tax=Modestobacter roseus TaxID=1181884 RepID=A0A562IQH7_9ACTN|nr:SDR family NAD(P)-dependent oxidoreductase [Modestobacter roseus]MQA33151.1 SDR family NAD(P)-dependent oxidoreductase [Modestobacter roseus]TWH73299.1 short-subunit dehydrogenase [Modestobacter roseus]
MSSVSGSVSGKVAVVTGAGSGIGRQLAFELARRGARLAVSDVDEARAGETADRVRALGAQVHRARLDVADRAAVLAYADAVAGHFGVVHQVYNNAGVAGGTTVLDSDWADYDRIWGINLFGVLHGTKAFLPHLIASGDGHVVNVSSLNGIMAQASINAYSASKFAVRGFTEALRTEMLLAGHPVQVTVVHPGGVRTNIATAAFEHSRGVGAVTAADEARMRTYNEKLLRMPPEQAARIIVTGVEAGRPRVLVGNDAKLVDLLVRLVPASYPRLAARLQRRAERG